MQQEAGKWYSLRRNIAQDLKNIASDLELINIRDFQFTEHKVFYLNEILTFSYQDQDGDLIPDEIEDQIQFNMHAMGDLDGDGTSNLDEVIDGTFADQLADDDNDGISNSDEANIYNTNPLINEFDGTIDNIINVDPASPSATRGDWHSHEGSILAISKRGSLEYTIDAPSEGMYQLKVLASQGIESSNRNSLKVQLYVDGQYVRTNSIDVTYGEDTSSYYLTQNLSKGTHTIQLVYDNVYEGTSLRINAIDLGVLGGPDNNENGLMDWVETNLNNTATLETTNFVSTVSPAQIEGKSRYLHQVEVTGSTVKRGTLNHWYSNIALSATESTDITVSFEDGLKSESHSLTWIETNAVVANNMQIINGSSLLLNAGVSDLDTAVITVEGINYNTSAANPIAHQFNTDGIHTVNALVTTESGIESYSFDVEVISAPQVEAPYVWSGKGRSWNWDLDDSLTVEAPGMDLTGENGEFTIERHEILEDVNIIARLGEHGQIIASIDTKAFRAFDVVEGYVEQVDEFEDGTTHLQDTMFGINIPEGLELELTTFSGIVFEDGSRVKILTKDSLNETDEYELNFFKDVTRGGSICHRFKVYQNGVLVGEGHK